LEAYDKRYGYRGPITNFESFDDWKARLDAVEVPKDIGDWRAALILETGTKSAKIGLARKRDESEDERPDQGVLTLEGMKWAAFIGENGKAPEPKAVSDSIKLGDVILVSQNDPEKNEYSLQQVPDVNGGLIAMDPHTGRILALIGGYSFNQSQFNRATQALRQPGSSFKPFVYATAINQLQLSPCFEVNNTPYTIPQGKYGLPEDWTPKNSTAEYGGTKTLKNALANSTNVVSAYLIDQVTPKNVVRLANNLGVTHEIPEVPSIALGSVDLTLYEIVGAYNSYANKGMYVEPMMIMRIEDKNGTVLTDFTPKTKEVLSEQSAYTVLDLLQGVTEYGSGVRLRSQYAKYPDSIVSGYPYKFTNPIAGKTGTTQNQSDGWFMGMVPNLTTGVWVGAEDRAAHFSSITYGQGASMALPIWALYMKACYADETLDVSTAEFEEPELLSIEVDCTKFAEDQKNKKRDDDLDESEIDF